MAKKNFKLKKGHIVWIILLGVLLALVLGVFAVVKLYLGQMGRIENEVVEVIAPEDEFFDEDVVTEDLPVSTPVELPNEPAPEQESSGQSGTTSGTAEGTGAGAGSSSGSGAGSGGSAAAGTGSGAASGSGSEAKPGTTTVPVVDVLNLDPEDVEWSFIERIEDDHLINILLVGQDKYPGTGGTNRQRSDTMILCSINPKTGEVSMISFLRDLYVEIPGGYSSNRLNVPFVLGGFPLLNKTLTTNFGVSIDANFMVDMTGFKAIIELLGGVDVELTAKEAAYMGGSLQEGVNRLNANQALAYSQLRAIDSDFGRTGRQRKVLMSVFQEVRGLPVSQLMGLMYDMLPYVSTDLTDTQIITLAYRLLPMVSSFSVETHSVPASGSYQYATIRKMSVLLPDRQKIRQQLQDEYLPLY